MVVESVVDLVGMHGIGIFAAYVGYTLFYRKTYLWGFLALCAFTVVSNVFLKTTIQQPRPNPQVYADSESHRYGMPSGHMQLYVAIAVYYAYVQPAIAEIEWIVIVSAFVLTVAEIYKNRKHTWTQMGVGAVLGAASGWVAQWMTKRWRE